MACRYPLLFRSTLAFLFLLTTLLAARNVFAVESPLDLRDIYHVQVDRQLTIPPEEQDNYAGRLIAALAQAGLYKLPPQFVVLVDRNPHVQAVFLYFLTDTGLPQLIGASPASTGRHGGFMYYVTPTGVYEHSLANRDFRAEGTKNSQGIMGYGIKGMRVYDFGWVRAERTWRPGEGIMRLQMHATDPRLLEQRLGSVQSMGCIRIPATLNTLIDHYGLLDADYDAAIAEGEQFWSLLPDREPTPWSGRYLVIIDSERTARPAWSTYPFKKPRLPVAPRATPESQSDSSNASQSIP